MAARSLKHRVPNIITIGRIIGTMLALPLFWCLDQTQSSGIHWLLFFWVILLCLSDAVDGWWARHYRCISNLGKHLDPLADKYLVILYLPLIALRQIHFLPIAILFMRDYAVTMLRDIASQEGWVIAARTSGKVKTLATFSVLCLMIAALPQSTNILSRGLAPWHQELYFWGGVAITIVSLWSLADYLCGFYSHHLAKRFGSLCD